MAWADISATVAQAAHPMVYINQVIPNRARTCFFCETTPV
jgi:hypothetical protein